MLVAVLRTASRIIELEIYRAVLAAIVKTYRAVVDNSNFHHRLEYTILHLLRLVQLLDFGKKTIIKILSLLSSSCTMEVGSISFFGGCEQCKLRDWIDIRLRLW